MTDRLWVELTTIRDLAARLAPTANAATLAVLLGLISCSPKPEPPSPAANARVEVPMQFYKAQPEPPAPSFTVISRDFTEVEKNIMEEAVKEELKDPFSAQFKWPEYHNSSKSSDAGSYCGYVNAKNSHGGYVGFTRYIADFTEKGINGEPKAVVVAMADADPNSADSLMVSRLCGWEGY